MTYSVENLNARQRILGLPVDVLSLEATVETIMLRIKSCEGGVQNSINSLKLLLCRRNAALVEAIEESDICSADGMSFVFASIVLGPARVSRVAGIDLFERLLSECERSEVRIFLLGSSDFTLKKLSEELLNLYPKLCVVGVRNGFWESFEDQIILNEIKSSQAQICFVALPTPNKELWMQANKKFLMNTFLVAVGGSFEVLAKQKKRAPKWMQSFGLEWLYRVLQEPRRLIFRYALANSYYFIKLIQQILKKLTRINNE